MASAKLPVPPVGGQSVPADLGPALRTLERAHVDRVRAPYAIAYRITFESRERIVGASTEKVRYRPYQRLVAASPRVAYVFVRDSASERRFARRGYVRSRAGDWDVWLPRGSR
jgi:hypothetical protein